MFGCDCHLKTIGGFRGCISLRRIDIPSSVEIIDCFGFHECRRLSEVIFGSDCHLKRICGFQKCTSLRRIDIPSSVELIDDSGFSECTALSEVIFGSGCHLKMIHGFQACPIRLIVFSKEIHINNRVQFRRLTPFIMYHTTNLPFMRRGIHLRDSCWAMLNSHALRV
jgi:hypothetical protein